MTKARTPLGDLPAAQQAGILCNDPRFQEFAAVRQGWPGLRFNSTATAEFLRQACGIQSRRDLNKNKDARTHFEILKTEFDSWRGKIASPR